MVTAETDMSFDKHLMVLENDTASPDEKLSAFECLGRFMIQILKNKEDVDSSLFNDDTKLKHFVWVLEQYINSSSESLMLSALTVLEHGLTLLQPKMEESSVIHVGTCCLDVLQQRSLGDNDILNNIDVPLKFFKCLCKLGDTSFNTLFQDKAKYDLALELIKKCWDYSMREENTEDDTRICTVLKVKSLTLFIKLTVVVDNTDPLCESILKNDFDFWLLQLFPSMFVDEDEVRILTLEAIKGLRSRVGPVSYKDLNCWPKLKDDLKTIHSKQLMKFAEYNKPDWAALWCFILDILGDELHLKQNNQLINCLLEAEEKAFKSVCTETRRDAFLCWKHLIDKFLVPSAEDVTRRLKLLMQPMTANNSKTDVMSRVKLEVWWHLIMRLEPVMERHSDVVLHFLRFSFGPLGDTPLLSLTLMESPKGSLIGTPISVRRASNFTMKPVILSPGRRFPILHMPCADALAQILTTNYENCKVNFLLPHFSSPLISNPMMFLKLSKMLVHSVGECTLLLGNSETRVPLSSALYIEHLWKSLMNHIIASLKLPRLYESTNEKITEMVRDLLKLLQNMVEVSANNPNLAQICLSPVLDAVLLGENALPTEVLMSQTYHLGTQDLMFGTPLLLMVDLFLSPSVLALEAKQPKYLTFLQYILKMGIGPAESTIAFTQAIVRRLEIAINFDKPVTKASGIGTVWNLVARLLASFVGIGRDINQGTPEMRDYKCLYAVLLFPIQHVDICMTAVPDLPKGTGKSFPAPVVVETVMSQLQKTWSHLFQAFQTNVFSDAASRLETNELCEQLCCKVLQEVGKHSNLSCKELMCIATLVTEAIRLIPYTDLNVNVSMELNINLPNQPWHGLKNTVLLLQKVSEHLRSSKDTEDSYINLAVILAKCMSILMLNVQHFVIASALCSELLEDIHFLLNIRLNDEPSDTHDFKIHILKLWMDFMKLVTEIWNKKHFSNLKSFLPLFETTLRHPVTEIRCHTLKLFKEVFLEIYLAQNVTLPDSLQEAVNECPEADDILRDCSKEEAKTVTVCDVVVPTSPTESLKALQGSDFEDELESISTGGNDDKKIEIPVTKLPLVSDSNKLEIKASCGTVPAHKDAADSSNLKKQEASTATSAFSLNKKSLTPHQREMRRKRRDDIPALYSDLTQESQNISLSEASQDNSQFTIPERFKTITKTSSTTSVSKMADHPFSPIFTGKKSTSSVENDNHTPRSTRRQKPSSAGRAVSLGIINESVKDEKAIDQSEPSTGKHKASPPERSIKSIKQRLSSANTDVTNTTNISTTLSSDTTITPSVAKFAASTVTLTPRKFKPATIEPYSNELATSLSINKTTPSVKISKPSTDVVNLREGIHRTKGAVQNSSKVEHTSKLSKTDLCDKLSPVKVVVERLHFDNVDISEAVRMKLESKFASTSSDKISPSHRRKSSKPRKKNLEELKHKKQRSRKSKRSKPTDPVEVDLAKLFDKEEDSSENCPLKAPNSCTDLENILQDHNSENNTESPLNSVSGMIIEENIHSLVLEPSLDCSKMVQSSLLSAVDGNSKLGKSKKGLECDVKKNSKPSKKTRLKSCIAEIDVEKKSRDIISNPKVSRKSHNAADVNKKLFCTDHKEDSSFDLPCAEDHFKLEKSKRDQERNQTKIKKPHKTTRLHTCITDVVKKEFSELTPTSKVSKKSLNYDKSEVNKKLTPIEDHDLKSESTDGSCKLEKCKEDLNCEQTKIRKSPIKIRLQSCSAEVEECNAQNSLVDGNADFNKKLATDLSESGNKIDSTKTEEKVDQSITPTSPRKKQSNADSVDVVNKHSKSSLEFICKQEMKVNDITNEDCDQTTTAKSPRKLQGVTRVTDKDNKLIENVLEPVYTTSAKVKKEQQDDHNSTPETISKTLLPEVAKTPGRSMPDTVVVTFVDDVLMKSDAVEVSGTSDKSNINARKDHRDGSKTTSDDDSTVTGKHTLLKTFVSPGETSLKTCTRRSRRAQQFSKESDVQRLLISDQEKQPVHSSSSDTPLHKTDADGEEGDNMKIRPVTPLSKRLRSKTATLLKVFQSPTNKSTHKSSLCGPNYSGKNKKSDATETAENCEIVVLSDNEIQASVTETSKADVTSKSSNYSGSNLENSALHSPVKELAVQSEGSVKTKDVLTEKNGMPDSEGETFLNVDANNSLVLESTEEPPVLIKSKTKCIQEEIPSILDESSAVKSSKIFVESSKRSKKSKVNRAESDANLHAAETSQEEILSKKEDVAALGVIAETQDSVIDITIIEETQDLLDGKIDNVSLSKDCVDTIESSEIEDIIESSQDQNITISSNIVKECRITLHKIPPWLTTSTVSNSVPILPVQEEEKTVKLTKRKFSLSPKMAKAEEGNISLLPKMAIVEEGNISLSPKMAKVEEGNISLSPKMAKVEEGNISLSPKMAKVEEGNISLSPKMAKVKEGNISLSPKMAKVEEGNISLSPKMAKVEEGNISLSPKMAKVEEGNISLSPKLVTVEGNNFSEKLLVTGLDTSNDISRRAEQSFSGNESAAGSETNTFHKNEDLIQSKSHVAVSDVSNDVNIPLTTNENYTYDSDKPEKLTKTKVLKRRSKLCGLPRELRNLEIAFRAECGGSIHESDKTPEDFSQEIITNSEHLTRRKKESILTSRDSKSKQVNYLESFPKTSLIESKLIPEDSKLNQCDSDTHLAEALCEKMLPPKKRCGVSKKTPKESELNNSLPEVVKSSGDDASNKSATNGLDIEILSDIKEQKPLLTNLSAETTEEVPNVKDFDRSCNVSVLTKDEIITKPKRPKPPKTSKVDVKKHIDAVVKSEVVSERNIGLKPCLGKEADINPVTKRQKLSNATGVDFKKTKDIQNMKSGVVLESRVEDFDMKQNESLKKSQIVNTVNLKHVIHETKIQSTGTSEGVNTVDLRKDDKEILGQDLLSSLAENHTTVKTNTNQSVNEQTDSSEDQKHIDRTVQRQLKRKLVSSKTASKKCKMTKVETVSETKIPFVLEAEPSQMKMFRKPGNKTHVLNKSQDNIAEESEVLALEEVFENKDSVECAKVESGAVTELETRDISPKKEVDQMSKTSPERFPSSGSYLMNYMSPSKMKISRIHRRNVKHSSVRAAHLVGLAVGEGKWGGKVRWCDESEMIQANSEVEELEGENMPNGTDTTEGQSDMSRDFKENNQKELNMTSPLHLKAALKRGRRISLSPYTGKKSVLLKLNQELEDTVHKINYKGEVHTSEWVKRAPVCPEFNPGPSILKKRKADVEVEPEVHSPTNKKKRLSFKDPEVIECLTFKRSERKPQGGHSLRFRKDGSRVDLGRDRNVRSSKPEQRSVSGLPFFGSEPDSQGSVDEPSPRLMDSQQPVYPSLKNCQYPIESIVNNLTDSIWVKALLLEMTQRNIYTVGDLCSLDEASVNLLPLKTPKVDNLKLVLGEYERDLRASYELQNLKQSQSVHEEGPLTIEAMVDTIMSQPKSVDYLAVALSRHCPASVLGRMDPDILARHVAKKVDISRVLAEYLANRPDASLLANEIVDFIVEKLGVPTKLTDCLPPESLLEGLTSKGQLGLAVRELSLDELLAESVSSYGVNHVIKSLFKLDSLHPKLAVTCSLNCLLPKVDKEFVFKHFSEEEHVSYVVEKFNVDSALKHLPLEKLMECVCKKLMKEPLAQKSALNTLLSTCDINNIVHHFPVDRLTNATEAGGSKSSSDTLDALTKTLIGRYSRETILNELPYESVVQFGLSKLELIDKIGLCTEAIKNNKDEVIPINVVKTLLSNMADSISEGDFVSMCFEIIKEKCVRDKT